MSTKKHAVKVMIGGDEYTVRSDLPPEYTRDVAAYVDQALKKVLSQGPIVETHKAAILAALDITNERSEEHTSELQSHHDIVCRLLLEKKKNITDQVYQQNEMLAYQQKESTPSVASFL